MFKFNENLCCCPIHCDFQNGVWFWCSLWPRTIEKCLLWHQNFPINCRNFPTKNEGCCFPSDTMDFHPSEQSENIFYCLRCLKACCGSQEKSLCYWWYFSSTQMHFSVGIICFRLLFLQCTCGRRKWSELVNSRGFLPSNIFLIFCVPPIL